VYFTDSSPSQTCPSCTGIIPAAALECPFCHTLTHASQLDQLSALARELEGRGQLTEAQSRWQEALKLLPAASTQAEWVRTHTQQLAKMAAARAPQPENRPNWARKLGPLAPIAVALSKAKVLFGLLKLNFLLTLVAFIGVYWAMYGAKFGIGFAVLILLHEMGHFIDIKRRGLPADMPVFLPGLGAYVRWQALGVPLETRAAVSLAGPLAGFLASVGCAFIWWQTRDGIWAALARSGAWLNVLNLAPVWILDGGQAALALSRQERVWILTSCVALALLLDQRVFFLVALGAAFRLFTKDLPERPSPFITAYFIAVLAALGSVMWLLPGPANFGPR
jgi:Zn-dependent protease